MKRIKELSRKKQQLLLEVNRKRQSSYFNQQQYRFYQTTNEHGADIIDEDSLENGEPVVKKSLW